MKIFITTFIVGLMLATSIRAETTFVDPNTFSCYEEYDCLNGCGIVQITVNGKSCQVCSCGEQYSLIKFVVFPYTLTTLILTRTSRPSPISLTTTQNVPTTTTIPTTTSTTTTTTTLQTRTNNKPTNIGANFDPRLFLCFDEYDCDCGVVEIVTNFLTCQVCSCGTQHDFFMKYVFGRLPPKKTEKRSTTKKLKPKSDVSSCYNETNCGSCGIIHVTVNGTKCDICQCGLQMSKVIKDVLPYFRSTVAKSVVDANLFQCFDEPVCLCGTLITKLKGKTCKICKCGKQMEILLEHILPKMVLPSK